MHRIKATDVLALRKMFAERPAEDTERLLTGLDADARALYETARAVDWCDAAVLCRLHQQVASILFPHSRKGLTLLGEELGERSYSTVYKLLLAVPSFSFVVRRAGALWSAYHASGIVKIEDLKERSLTFVVREAPEFPEPLTGIVSGTILALGKITRTKNPRVQEGGSPEAWRWAVSWEK
jgi:hypothetical protein